MPDLIDYLEATVAKGGSDLHIASGTPAYARINGDLEQLEDQVLDPDTTRNLIYAILTESQRARFEKEYELDFAISIESAGRFRGNAHYTRGNVEAAFRHIPDVVPDIQDLGHGHAVEKLADEAQGLVLVTGVTGSGKTTTLAAMAKRILSRRSCTMVTIEDPIEYVLNHGLGIVKQRQIGLDSHSFPNALRAALRQDPDVIIVSELRDLETIRTAITAAETGHLVIGTLHTIDAPKSIDRLIDVFPGDQQRQITTQIANCLIGIVSQRLIKRADAPGRVLASEVMLSNHAVQAVIREQRFAQLIGLIEINRGAGMHSIDTSLAHLLVNGHISLEDALTYCRDEEYIQDELAHALQAAARQEAAKN